MGDSLLGITEVSLAHSRNASRRQTPRFNLHGVKIALMHNLPFRLGATSYIVDAGLLDNAAFLCDKVQDMQLVLFDLPDGPSNLPDAATVAALSALADRHSLSYTVHLLDDMQLSERGRGLHPSLQRGQMLIELTHPLQPWAYVLHLDGRGVRDATTTTPTALQRWQTDSVIALDLLAGWTAQRDLLAVENLESYPPEFVTPVVTKADVRRCVDVGHLWLDGHDPLPHLAAAFEYIRVVHIHGLHDGRDHQSLAHMAPVQLDPVVEFLLQRRYTGVVTLEVFGEEDFRTSLQAWNESCHRCVGK
jgi:sugar phosphate isomerase/epimerase